MKYPFLSSLIFNPEQFLLELSLSFAVIFRSIYAESIFFCSDIPVKKADLRPFPKNDGGFLKSQCRSRHLPKYLLRYCKGLDLDKKASRCHCGTTKTALLGGTPDIPG